MATHARWMKNEFTEDKSTVISWDGSYSEKLCLLSFYASVVVLWFEPEHDETNEMTCVVHPGKAQISPVCSVFAWHYMGSNLQQADSK